MKHLWILVASLWAESALSVKGYRIKNVNGTVLVRGVTDATWTKIETQRILREGSLVQISGGSSITVLDSENHKYRGIGANRLEVIFKGPSVIRIGDHVFRPVVVDNVFIDKLPNVDLNKEVAGSELEYELEEAWERVAAIYTGSLDMFSALTTAPKKDDPFELVGNTKPIKIITPKQDAIMKTLNPPHLVRVIWRGIDKVDGYRVFAWRRGEGMGDPVAVVTTNYYAFKVPDLGRYYVMVESLDGNYRSIPHAFTLSDSVVSESGKGGESDLEAAYRAQVVELVHPTNATTILSEEGEYDVTFSWRQDPRLDHHVRLIKIYGKGQKLVARRDVTVSDYTSIKLRPGRYYWFITGLAKDFKDPKKTIVFKSDRNSLRVAKGGRNLSEKRVFIRKLIEGNVLGSVYFEDGFN